MKKLLLSLLVGASAISAISAANITAADLIGKKCAWVTSGTNIKYGVGQYHGCSDVTKGSSNNQIIIKNFLGLFDLPVTVSNNALTVNMNSSFSGSQTFYLKKRNFKYGGYVPMDNSGNIWYAECYTVSGGTLTSSSAISSPNDYFCSYNFSHSDSSDPLLGFCVYTANNASIDYFGAFDLYFLEPNAIATQTMSNGSVSTYDVRLTLSSPNTLRIDNLFDYGMMYENEIDPETDYYSSEVRYIDAELDLDNGTFVIPFQKIGGRTFSASAYGTSDVYNKYGSYLGYTTGYWEIGYNFYIDSHYLASYASKANDEVTGADVTGSFSLDYKHTKGNNMWVSNGGTTKTYIDADLTLNNAKVFSGHNNAYIKDTKTIAIKGKIDVTHNVDLNVLKWGANEEIGFYIATSIEPDYTRPTDHIASYDLFLLEGTHTSATAADFSHEKNGHNDAIWLTDPSKHYFTFADPQAIAPRSASDASAHTVRLHVPAADLDNIADNYTVFLRTNYDNGLEPTFHALTPLTNPTVTGIDEIESDDCNWTVSTANGSIVVKGAENQLVEVYSISGTQVYCGNDTEIAVAPGLYVVRIGDNARKLAVR